MGSGNFIRDMFDSSISAEVPMLEASFPHITKAYFANAKLVDLIQVISTTYTVKRGDSLSKIATSQSTTPQRIKSDNRLTNNTIHPDQILILSKDEVIGQKIEIDRKKAASIGSKMHIVVETKNFKAKTLKVNIKQGVEKTIADVDSAIAVQVDEESKGIIEIETGKFAADSTAQNKNDFVDFAIIEVCFKADSGENTKKWNVAIRENSNKNAKLYLTVDAHSGNTDIAANLFNYYGKNKGTESVSNRWLDLDGLWFELTESVVPWIDTIYGEVGVKEKSGPKADPRILEYFEAAGYWGTDDSGGENAWCGSFTAWVMAQHGYKLPRASYRAKSWIDFGKQIAEPVYGAIGIKSRTGGGHVSFIIGKNEDGTKYFMLGGNQGDKIQVRQYDKDVWTYFVIPSDYDEAAMPDVPIYSGVADAGSRES